MIAQHPKLYGVPWIGTENGLSNLQIGGSNLRQVSFFLRAQASKTCTTFSFYMKGTASGAGYGAGTCGTLRADLFACDPVTLAPTGSALATATLPASTTDAIRTFTWGTPYAQTGGAGYHYVMTNTDASPLVNYCSEDDFDQILANPRQRGVRDADCSVWMNDNNAGWAINTGHFPGCFDVGYSDGSHDGMAFYNALSGSGLRDVGGANNAVRLNFTPSQSFATTRAYVGFYKQASSSVAVDLENYRGATKFSAGQAAFASVSLTRPGWVRFDLPYTIFERTVNYTSQLWSRSETVNYKAYCLQAGGAGFGASLLADTAFPDGYWEYTTDGSTWLQHLSSTAYKPMLYFEVAEPDITPRRAAAVMA